MLLTAIFGVPAPVSAATGTTTRVSVASDGTQANSASFDPAVSGDGRYVAFSSLSDNLVPGDTNGVGDVFVYDRDTGGTERVSIASDGTQATGNSGFEQGRPAISADGRYVAFTSFAPNLVPADTNNAPDVFVHDRHTGGTERVSVASDGSQASFHSSGAGFGSFRPSISGDGRYVAFFSRAVNLVADDTNNGDVFVHDRVTGSTERVSVASDGTQTDIHHESYTPAISGDGRYVAFTSRANNLVPGDTNGTFDAFVRDRTMGSTERVSVAGDGSQADGDSVDPAISADGRYVAFGSVASNLVPGDTNDAQDVFVHDRVTGSTERASVAGDGAQANGIGSTKPAISADGRYVAFGSFTNDLVPGDTSFYDMFVRDRVTGSIERASVANDGTQANENSLGVDNSPAVPAISADGRYVAFTSRASNLVPGDTNGISDVFVRDRAGVAPSDTTPPTLALPGPITAEATGPAGTTVTYTVTAADDTDPNPAVSCAPASGSTFPIGATTVVCTATDVTGNQATGSFTVTVVDTTAPALTLPGTISTDATGPAGTPVSYTATAADAVDANPSVSCIPASGSTFPIGATTVDCSATDATGNQASGSFTVTVAGAAGQTDDLEALIITYSLKATVESSLLKKITGAQEAIAAGKTDAACSKLADFLDQVADFRTAGKLTDAQATELTTDATRIRAALGC